MPKTRGDVKTNRVQALGEIAQEFVRDIGKTDVRYNRFRNYLPIPKLMKDGEFFSTEKRVKSIFGANRSSKTTACAFEAVMLYTGIIPECMKGVYAQEDKLRALTQGPGKRARYVRIIVMDYSEHWPMTIEPMLTSPDFGMLPESWSSDYDPQTHMFHGPDGSILDIYSADPSERDEEGKGERKLRGPRIDHTWIDEINREGVYTESAARPAAHADSPGTLSLSFCPQEGVGSWTTDTFVRARYYQKGSDWAELPEAKKNQDVYAINVAMRDNPSISDEECARQKRLYKEWEWPYRVDGWPTHRTSNVYFCMEDLVKWEDEPRYSPGVPVQIIEDKIDPESGVFEGHMNVIEDEGLIQPGAILDERKTPIWRIWEEAIEGEKYVLAGDIAEGNPKSDPQSVSVWKCTDKLLPVQVAQLHIVEMKAGEVANQCGCMANIYGACLLIPEQNNTGGGQFIQQARHYPNLYRRRSKDDTATTEVTEKLGWHTDKFNKGPMLANAYRMLATMAAVRLPNGEDEEGKPLFKNHCPFNSRISLLEFESYEERLKRDAKTDVATVIWGARMGAHDDAVMEAVIAFQIINYEYNQILPCKLKPKVVHPTTDEHYLGQKQGITPKAFSNYKKQPKMSTLRKQSGAGNGRGGN